MLLDLKRFTLLFRNQVREEKREYFFYFIIFWNDSQCVS